MVESDAGPDELDVEQRAIDVAYACLRQMRARAEELEAEWGGANADPDLRRALAHRVRVLADSNRALCFGRIDHDDGQRWYVGRRHVEDEAAEPVVIEWRAPVAVPYYRARPSEPMGLVRRRQFVVDGPVLVSMADDTFGVGAGQEGAGPRVRGRDALLAELERARTGEMLDIVATIQVEQDEIIRSPLPGVMAVQGGPGTGKTAIGLHRAAFLLYGNDVLARQGVLVVGPNRTFLRYIAQVLPSLGEEAVVQTTLRDLVPDAPGRGEDTVAAQRIKGDGRLADVLRRALAAARRPLEHDLEVRFGHMRLVVPAADANALAATVAARDTPYSAGRTALREQLIRAVARRHTARVGHEGADETSSLTRSLRTDKDFTGALDRLWPSVAPAALVADLLSSPTRLARAAEGVLSAEEQTTILRPAAAGAGSGRVRSGATGTGRRRAVPWTDADAALVDEAHELIGGRARAYGHVVVDEAQDLSPMQIRMLARRCPSGSMTLMGDLAQGIGVWAVDRWEDLVAQLPTPDGSRVEELLLGYRSPGQVLDFAGRLLPVAAPNVPPTESIRLGRTEPHVLAVDGDDLLAAAMAEVRALRERWASVAVVVPVALLAAADKALAGAGMEYGEAGRDGIGHPVTLLSAPATKGLEFDAVVVVEPTAIMQDAPRGLRLLYVALTRPTQHLSVVHSEPLPVPLAG